ncbi:MAG TPA: TlpA disulfide reductase family protein [Candidatus Deferrimicrobium sp.]|nr:TlpA disulfide reductase family protein [Candidatus Deferrimicrobium sp.]
MSKNRIKRKRISKVNTNGEKSTQEETSQERESPQKRVSLKKIKRRRQQSSSLNISRLITVIGVIIVVVAVGFILIGNPNQENGNNGQGQYAIPYSVTTIHGETINLSTYYGKTVFYYFTGATCIPCKAQLPYLVDAYDYYKPTGKIEIFSFDIQGYSINDLLTWESDNHITWKVCQDSGLILSTYFSIAYMPTLVICDETGHEINRYIGANDNQTIWAIFESAIN